MTKLMNILFALVMGVVALVGLGIIALNVIFSDMEE